MERKARQATEQVGDAAATYFYLPLVPLISGWVHFMMSDDGSLD